jgi:acid stress-induced BolA-like protein IbaG/YrbA
MTESEVVARIQQALPAAQVVVSGENCHLTLTIVSEFFEGKSLLARHRMIQALFQSELADGSLHALSLQTKTPAEQA